MVTPTHASAIATNQSRIATSTVSITVHLVRVSLRRAAKFRKTCVARNGDRFVNAALGSRKSLDKIFASHA